uniref:Uncharacterized protein n=1 Tax=Anguilla anguilla TaxID=7936 RepID=A0A0E9VBN6_ANGAN
MNYSRVLTATDL